MDMGIYLPPASLGDRVWIDADHNGIQDAGEDNVSGVKVYLLDSNGDRMKDAGGNDISTDTNASGEYIFDGLAPGTYSVEFDLTTLPAGYAVTTAGQGTDETGSDADETTGKTTQVTLAAGEHNPTLGYGYLPPTGKPG